LEREMRKEEEKMTKEKVEMRMKRKGMWRRKRWRCYPNK